MCRRPPRSPRRRHGFSLVELMVALALGLLLVAVAGSVFSVQLRALRDPMREVRLTQDLRTAADLITRDLRRAGHWGHAAAGVWQPGAAAAPALNPYGPAGLVGPDTLALRYSRDAVENDVVDDNERFGYRLRAGVVELELGAGNWQALTDPAAMTVTAFSLTPTVDEIALAGSCVAACPTGGPHCPPRQQVQRIAFALTARSAADPRVVRSLGGTVRPRTDAVVGACPAA